jgi:PIN domain nuclease of toxin-antitoxin system
MRILIDTHVLLWAQIQPKRLSPSAREMLEDPQHTIVFSAVSIWEIAIKRRLRKGGFDVDPLIVLNEARSTGYEELPVTADVAASVVDLPMHHADPFDRLLIAQVMHLPARLLTVDKQLAPYSELVTLV